jgi:hypothetical protein
LPEDEYDEVTEELHKTDTRPANVTWWA